MGGNHFGNGIMPRMSTELYRRRCVFVTNALRPHTKACGIPRCFSDKLDHGDIDVICFPKPADPLIRDFPWVKKVDGPFLFCEDTEGPFQCDLTETASLECFDFSLQWHSYSDVGNIVGRIVRSMGLTFCENGVEMRLEEKKQRFATLMLSCQWDHVMAFIGFDAVRFRHGFDTDVQMFEWVCDNTNNFFQPRTYVRPTEHNSALRRKLTVRPVHARFIQYVRQRYAIAEDDDEPLPPKLDQAAICQHALDHFDCRNEYERLCQKERRLWEWRKFMSAERIQKWIDDPRCEGRALGDLMNAARLQFPFCNDAEDETTMDLDELKHFIVEKWQEQLT